MLRGKPKAQKEKSLPHLNHFLAEKVAKSVVRPSFLVYHLFAVRIRLSLLPCHVVFHADARVGMEDNMARQKRQPYPHSEQVIYQKARSYD